MFFHEKSYPREGVLRSIYDKLTSNKIPSEKLRQDLNMSEEEFDAALEKLWIHGGALVSPDEMVQKGGNNWRTPYKDQREHRLAQIDEISRFASSFSCRMLYLVKHFGDREDIGNECGICDFCTPASTSKNIPRNPNKQEELIIRDVISMLKTVDSLSTGVLFGDACSGLIFSRSEFENLLKSLVKSGLLIVSEHAFEKEGRLIHYKRAGLTNKGRSFDMDDCGSIEMLSFKDDAKRSKKKQSKRRKKVDTRLRKSTGSGINENPLLYETIREWRLRMAKKRGVPAFRIFTNKVLDNISQDLPTSLDELHMVHGVGPYFVQKYGKEIVKMVKEYLANNLRTNFRK